MRPVVWVIVLNWNNYNDTRECIDSIRRSTFPVEKVVLVDNGSDDCSLEKLQNDYLNEAKIHIIRNEANFGFARGVNVGIQYALTQNAEFIMLVNNDAVIEKTCIQNLVLALHQNPKAGIAGPRIFYYSNPVRIWHGGGYYSWLKTGIVNPEKSKEETHCASNTREVTFLTGCVMLIRRQVFEKIGLFDEDYYFYYEDVDFCLRTMKAGFKLLYVPSAKAWHKIEDISKNRTSTFVLYHLAKSRIIFLRKNFSRPYFLYGLLIHFTLYTPFRHLQVIKGSRSLKNIWAWLEGTWAGIREPLTTTRTHLPDQAYKKFIRS